MIGRLDKMQWRVYCLMYMIRILSNIDSEMKVKGKERNFGRINIFMLINDYYWIVFFNKLCEGSLLIS